MAKIGKVRIKGKGGNSLEIELLGNSDMSVTLTNTTEGSLTGDFPNPMNGGGFTGIYPTTQSL